MKFQTPNKSGLKIFQMSISKRLHLGFSIMLALALALGLLGYIQNNSQAESTQRLVSEDALRASLANDLQIAVQEMVIILSDLTQQEDTTEIARLQNSFKEVSGHYTNLKGQLINVPDRDADDTTGWKAALEDMVEIEKTGSQLFHQMAMLAGQGNPAAVRSFYEVQVYTPLQLWMDKLTTLRKSMALSMRNAADVSRQSVKVSQVFSLTMGVIVLGVGLVSAVIISRSITRPLQRAIALAEAVAQGDLTIDVFSDQRDEVGMLLNTLGTMQLSLRKLVGDINDCAGNIHTASTEVARGNSDLSQRTELAASNLQHTATSLEKLTDTVFQSADSAEKARLLTSSAISAASRGGEVMQRVVDNMSEISEASRKISEIIGVIDSIAFQTNLLALNAAVEAARAGDQGRGFAVVAGEVGNLAKRATTAAREIKSLIGTSVARVYSGAELVRDAGNTMVNIVDAVESVNTVIKDITAVTTAQNSGIIEVNSALAQLDKMTQQNSTLVEESAAAAEALRAQANHLNGLVGTFRLATA